MYCVTLFVRRVMQSSSFCRFSRSLCNHSGGDGGGNGFGSSEEYLDVNFTCSEFISGLDEETNSREAVGSAGASCSYGDYSQLNYSLRRGFTDMARSDADRALSILNEDGPGFDAKRALDDMEVTVSGLFVRLGKLDQFHRLLDEMGKNGFSPDSHTFNILLHVLGKGDKPLAALNLLNHMKEAGIEASVLHFTTLIDGLSRAGSLDACKYFFAEMTKYGCSPDVVCYTVIITGFIVAGELETAQEYFSEMIVKGQVPNVFTYNSMIRGLCMAAKFKEARLMLEDMESRGCIPNFTVYNTLVSQLRNAGKMSEANEVVRVMVEKGRYTDLISKFKRYRRC